MKVRSDHVEVFLHNTAKYFAFFVGYLFLRGLISNLLGEQIFVAPSKGLHLIFVVFLSLGGVVNILSLFFKMFSTIKIIFNYKAIIGSLAISALILEIILTF